MGVLALVWLPIYGVLANLIDDANTLSIVAMSALFIAFLTLLHRWNCVVYKRERPWHVYGLRWTWTDGYSLMTGCVISLLCLLMLFSLQAVLGWVKWTPSYPLHSMPPMRIVFEGLLIGMGVAFGEEIVFRGWLLDELEQDYPSMAALWGSSLLFAILHFIKPLAEIIRTFPQFPGLVLLGLMLVWAKRSRYGRLGIAIGLHAGLVWGYYIVNVGDLIQYQYVVPEWWTGIDKNPLAGLLGLGFLAVLALWFRHRAIVAFRE